MSVTGLTTLVFLPSVLAMKMEQPSAIDQLKLPLAGIATILFIVAFFALSTKRKIDYRFAILSAVLSFLFAALMAVDHAGIASLHEPIEWLEHLSLVASSFFLLVGTIVPPAKSS